MHADGVGDSVQVGPGLPPTGATVPVFGIVGGAVLLVLGVGALLVTGTRRRRREKDGAATDATVTDGTVTDGIGAAGAEGTPDEGLPDEGPAGSGGRT